MSLHLRGSRAAMFLCLFGAIGLLFLDAPLPAAERDDQDDEITEETIMATEMLDHRARLELKTAFIIPTNSKFDIETPVSTDNGFQFVGGIKGSFEVAKNTWATFEVDYARLESTSPVVPGTSQVDLLAARTEDLMEYYDRIQVFLGVDYDFVLGKSYPKPEWGLYSPIFRIGMGLGGTAMLPKEAEGNTLIKLHNAYAFVVRVPSLAFLFPFHENVGLFVQGDLDWVPYKVQMDGNVQGENVDVGNSIEFSSFNVSMGLMFQW